VRIGDTRQRPRLRATAGAATKTSAPRALLSLRPCLERKAERRALLRDILFRMSPTVFRSGPYRLFFFSNEGNEPPHVHVQRDRMLAKFWLTPVTLVSSTGFSAHELKRIRHIVADEQDALLEKWHEYFKR